MLSQYFYEIIYCGVSLPGHEREVVDGLNATEKRFLSHLIVTLKLPGAKLYETHMVIQYETSTADVILAR